MLIVNGFISIFCKQPDIMWQLLCQKKNQPRRQKEEESERLPKRRLLKCQQRHYVTLVLSIRFLVVHIVAVVDKRFLKYKNGIYFKSVYFVTMVLLIYRESYDARKLSIQQKWECNLADNHYGIISTVS